LRIGITGSNSSIGRSLSIALRSAGHEVIEFSRSEDIGSPSYFQLQSEGLPFGMRDIKILIHLAWDRTRTASRSESINIRGSSQLISELSTRGVRVIFLSTVSADSNSKSDYSREKFEVEQVVLKHQGTVIRAGVVTDQNSSGIFGIINQLGNLPLICPHLIPDPPLRLTRLDSLIDCCVDAVKDGLVAEVLTVADTRYTSLSELVHSIRFRNATLHVPVPLIVLRSACRRFSKFSRRIGRISAALETVNDILSAQGRDSNY